MSWLNIDLSLALCFECKAHFMPINYAVFCIRACFSPMQLLCFPTRQTNCQHIPFISLRSLLSTALTDDGQCSPRKSLRFAAPLFSAVRREACKLCHLRQPAVSGEQFLQSLVLVAISLYPVKLTFRAVSIFPCACVTSSE